MKLRILLVTVWGLFWAAPVCAGLNPEASAFLQELGLDATSPEVVAVADDNIDGKTLAKIAAKRDEMGVKRFIATRTFAHAFLKDPKTPFPPADVYDIYYLSKEETGFIGQAIGAELVQAIRAAQQGKTTP
jgi:hypothetical protein